MSIEYIKILDINRELIGVVDTAQSVIWHSMWFGVGDFEIYAKATPEYLELLQEKKYVLRSDDDEQKRIGIIERRQIVNDSENGRMILATGRLAKSVLERRIIYAFKSSQSTTIVPTNLSGKVEVAARKLVTNNIISFPADTTRNIPILELGPLANIPAVIVDEDGDPAEKQVTHDNLLTYTDALLQEYGLSASVLLNDDTKKLQYCVFAGTDRSVDNNSGNEPIVFSTDYDNLISSEYIYDISTERNTALIGGEGEGADRIYSIVKTNKAGLERREIWVDAKSKNQVLKASDLLVLFPTGTFTGTNFVVNGVVKASLVVDYDREYSLSSLQSKFPSGLVSGTKFKVGGETYANKIYGDDNNYKITGIGYKAWIDAEETEGDYKLSLAAYKTILNTEGKQTMAPMVVTESFSGTLNVTQGNYVLNRDFYLGDIVTVQDNDLQIYVNARITETTEVQDENGYTVEATYG